MSNIITVVTKDGYAKTGPEVKSSYGVGDAFLDIVFCGAVSGARALSGDDGTRTVISEGERYTGQKVHTWR